MEKQFFVDLTPEDRLRHRHFIRRARVICFTVQYETFIKNDWKPIARYDTAHNFVHLDIIHADGSVTKQRVPILDYNDAYTFADLNLKATFKKHKQRFIREMEEYYDKE